MTASKRRRHLSVELTGVQIAEGNTVLTLDYEGAQAAHHGNSWWGVAVGFRAMQAAAKELSQTTLWNRDNLWVVSGHPGPGVRDAIDYVTGCVKRKRFRLIGAQTGRTSCSRDMKYQWWVSDGRVTAIISLLPTFLPEAFFDLLDRLGSNHERADDQQQFEAFKAELEERIWNERLDSNFHVERLSVALKPGEPPAP